MHIESELDFENDIANGYKLSCTNKKQKQKQKHWSGTSQARLEFWVIEPLLSKIFLAHACGLQSYVKAIYSLFLVSWLVGESTSDESVIHSKAGQ